jgi:hypothetical protein
VLSKNIAIKVCRSIIFPLVLYACETWPLVLRDEHWLRAFSNRVLGNVVSPKREEVTGDGRALHNKELQDFSSSPNSIWVIKSRPGRWVETCNISGGQYRILMVTPEGKRPHERPRFRQILQNVHWNNLVQDRDKWQAVLNTIMNL